MGSVGFAQIGWMDERAFNGWNGAQQLESFFCCTASWVQIGSLSQNAETIVAYAFYQPAALNNKKFAVFVIGVCVRFGVSYERGAMGKGCVIQNLEWQFLLFLIQVVVIY